MVDHFASRVLPTRSRARVLAFLTNTSEIRGTLGAHNALRPAAGRATDVRRQTGTDGLSVGLSALAVRTTRRRLAWVSWCCRQFCTTWHIKYKAVLHQIIYTKQINNSRGALASGQELNLNKIEYIQATNSSNFPLRDKHLRL